SGILAIDVGSGSVKAAYARVTGAGSVEVRPVRIPLPEGADASEDSGLLIKSVLDRAAGAIEAVKAAVRCGPRDVVWMALPSKLVEVVDLRLPPMPLKEALSYLRVHWDMEFRTPLEEAVVQYKYEPSQRGARLLVAASRRSAVAGFRRLASLAGLKCRLLEPEHMALLRLALYQVAVNLAGGVAPSAGRGGLPAEVVEAADRPGSSVAWAVVDMGYSSARVVAYGPRAPLFYSEIPVGGSALDGLLAEAFGTDRRTAAEIKKDAGLFERGPGAPHSVVYPAVLRLVEQVKRSLEYYLIKNDDVWLAGLVLAGGLASMPGLKEEIERLLIDSVGWRAARASSLARVAAAPGGIPFTVELARCGEVLSQATGKGDGHAGDADRLEAGPCGRIGPEFACAAGLLLRGLSQLGGAREL
ncbi:MAG: pilus assembly protein PilM, partial [Bacillota bacterium]